MRKTIYNILIKCYILIFEKSIYNILIKMSYSQIIKRDNNIFSVL